VVPLAGRDRAGFLEEEAFSTGLQDWRRFECEQKDE
jgi:hypothetical protein